MAEAIPVLDFSDLEDPAKYALICTQVARACETSGFFEISNSGIPLAVMDEAFDTSQEFFSRPIGEKMEVFQPPLGYFNHLLDGVRSEEMTFVHRPHTSGEKQTPSTGGDEVDPTEMCWPSSPRGYRPKMERIATELGKLADTLLDVFSESLGLPRTFLREAHHKNTILPRHLSVIYYPPEGNEDDANNSAADEFRDGTVFTMMVQGCATDGLQIKQPGSEWKFCRPQRGGVVVSVGDILQIWSNGRFRSTPRRVVSNRTESRHTIVYYLFPVCSIDANYICEPIPEFITIKNPNKFPRLSYFDYFSTAGPRCTPLPFVSSKTATDSSPTATLATDSSLPSANLAKDSTPTSANLPTDSSATFANLPTVYSPTSSS